MFVGPLEARKITFVVGYNNGYMRMKAYADLHAYLEVSSLTLRTMFKLAQKRRFYTYELDSNIF